MRGVAVDRLQGKGGLTEAVAVALAKREDVSTGEKTISPGGGHLVVAVALTVTDTTTGKLPAGKHLKAEVAVSGATVLSTRLLGSSRRVQLLPNE